MVFERVAHVADCSDRCTDGCPVAAVETQLEQPLGWLFDQRQHARALAAEAALWRGELPARAV